MVYVYRLARQIVSSLTVVSQCSWSVDNRHQFATDIDLFIVFMLQHRDHLLIL